MLMELAAQCEEESKTGVPVVELLPTIGVHRVLIGNELQPIYFTDGCQLNLVTGESTTAQITKHMVVPEYIASASSGAYTTFPKLLIEPRQCRRSAHLLSLAKVLFHLRHLQLN